MFKDRNILGIFLAFVGSLIFLALTGCSGSEDAASQSKTSQLEGKTPAAEVESISETKESPSKDEVSAPKKKDMEKMEPEKKDAAPEEVKAPDSEAQVSMAESEKPESKKEVSAPEKKEPEKKDAAPEEVKAPDSEAQVSTVESERPESKEEVSPPEKKEGEKKEPEKKEGESKAPPPEEPQRSAGMQIIISYKDAKNPISGITRTKEEANQLAKEVLSQVKAPGAKFEDLVKKYSDQPEIEKTEGIIGVFYKDEVSGFYRGISDLLFKMELGEVSDILDTTWGYIIVRRIPVVDYGCSHIWIHYVGAEGVRPDCKRNKEEAQALAKLVLEKAKKSGAVWEELVQEYSEDNDRLKKLGGFMGIFSTGSLLRGSAWPLGKALFQLELGGISGVTESPYGFHILKRIPVEEYRRGVSQILIKYKGSWFAKSSIKRSKEEAHELAKKVFAELEKDGSNFPELISKYSEGKYASKGGSLGYVKKLQYPDNMDQVIFSLKVGEISGIVESPEGFHIYRRWK